MVRNYSNAVFTIKGFTVKTNEQGYVTDVRDSNGIRRSCYRYDANNYIWNRHSTVKASTLVTGCYKGNWCIN